VVVVTLNKDKKLLDVAFSAGIAEIFAKHELDKITSYTAQFSKKTAVKQCQDVFYILMTAHQ
jgi:two-component system cell cycle response regulator